MSRFGVYIVGNDKVLDHVIALVNSLRYYNPNLSITLIPYDKEYQQVVEKCNIEVFPYLELIDELDVRLRDLFSLPDAPPQANKHPRLRNLATWFGDYKVFASFDADIVALTDIETFSFAQLKDCDFACYDRTYLHGVKWVFTEEVTELYNQNQLSKVFNNGFWISKSGLFSIADVFAHLQWCKGQYRYFDFKNGVIAQPIINSLLLSYLNCTRMRNPLQENSLLPEPWAGLSFEIKEHVLSKDGFKVPFLHWAGKEINESNRYYQLWSYYYNLSR